MKHLQLLFLCCCSSILAVTSCIPVDGYSCVSAYWDTVTCVLNITGYAVGQSNTTYSLKFIELSEVREFSCPLVVMDHSYSCVCKVTEDYDLSSGDNYEIKLCNETGCDPVTTDFEPSQNTMTGSLYIIPYIGSGSSSRSWLPCFYSSPERTNQIETHITFNVQLTPPHKAEVQKTPETFNITWKSGYEHHPYLPGVLEYELLLQTSQSTESKTLHPNLHKRSASIPRSQLKRDAAYCITVRSKPNHGDYKGTWSKWSPSTCWKEEEEEEVNTLVILTKSLVPVCVAVGVMLFVFYSPAVRMKIKTLSHTPSPATFFQPLFQQHKGNLQEWLSPHGRFVLTYKAEEILTTDAVIIVPKPITKDPEENQDFQNPTVQLAFTQGQTSYVGLPGIHEASPPLTMVCLEDTPYTQLPCPDWGVGIGEVEVVSTSPKDFFNTSRADSGCSCEDLTQSPECSLPNSPVADSSPPCYCNDYCILNKTAEGFAPVLVPKGSTLNVPSDSLQEE